MPSSYFLTTAQALLQQQVAQLAPQVTQPPVRPAPRRPTARRSLRYGSKRLSFVYARKQTLSTLTHTHSAAMDAAATTYESKASVGSRQVESLLGIQASPAPLMPESSTAMSNTFAADALHTTLHKPTACQHLVMHIATHLGDMHRCGRVHGDVSLATIACVGVSDTCPSWRCVYSVPCSCGHLIIVPLNPTYTHPLSHRSRLCNAGTIPSPVDAEEYVAPELRNVHATGRQPHATCRSDMFALGVVLYKVLTRGKVLWSSKQHAPSCCATTTGIHF